MEKSKVSTNIDKLVNQIIEKYNPIKIILFGSAAQSKSGEVNDVDFMIIKDKVPHYGADRIRQLYKLIESDIAVDYLVYKPSELEKLTLLGDPFIRDIVEKGTVLYG